MKDRLKREISLGCQVAIDGKYSRVGIVEAIGTNVLYLEDGTRCTPDDVLVMNEDNIELWIDDCGRRPNLYRTLCGQLTFCESPEEKADDLLVRAYMMAKDGKLDDYMVKNYHLEPIFPFAEENE